MESTAPGRLKRPVPVPPGERFDGVACGTDSRGRKRAKGNALAFNDVVIDGAAIEHGYAILTGNLRHFRKIPG